MRRIVLSIVIVSLCLLTSCTPSKFFLINSEGILTYNRHTGQLELLWQTKGAKGDTTDVVKCDSLLNRF